MSRHNQSEENMTSCSYNFTICDENSFSLKSSNRSFQYGDGLFETLFYRKGNIEYLNEHLNRLLEGLNILRIDCPLLKEHNNVKSHLEELIALQPKSEQYRIKIIAWRKEGGLFAPESSECDVLMLIKPVDITITGTTSSCLPYYENPIYPHSLSPYKRTSALHYIYAGIYKTEQQCNDVVLFTKKDHYYVSECLYSNIFWLKDDTLYTPSMATGCINGIIRQQLIKKAHQLGFTCETGFYTLNGLIDAETVFTANSAGLKILESIDNQDISQNTNLLRDIAGLIFTKS